MLCLFCYNSVYSQFLSSTCHYIILVLACACLCIQNPYIGHLFSRCVQPTIDVEMTKVCREWSSNMLNTISAQEAAIAGKDEEDD